MGYFWTHELLLDNPNTRAQSEHVRWVQKTQDISWHSPSPPTRTARTSSASLLKRPTAAMEAFGARAGATGDSTATTSTLFHGHDLATQPFLTKRGRKTNHIVRRIFVILDGALRYRSVLLCL